MVDDLRDVALVASGKVGSDWVYQKNGVRREYVIPTNPQTATQQAWRHQFGDVQKELVTMGDELRSQLSAALGYRWHALTLGCVLANDGAWWDEFATVFQGFDSGDQAAWAAFDDLVGLQNQAGLVFFVAASSVYRIVSRETGEEPFSAPTAENVSEIAAVWPKVESMDLPGFMKPFAGWSDPSGWLLCDGRSVLRASYPDLFDAIGDRFGADDEDHFTLPYTWFDPGEESDAGYIQETDGGWTFSGTWTYTTLAGANGGGIKYNANDGDYAEIVIECSRFVFLYTVNTNRDKMKITINGVDYDTINMYAASLDTQHEWASPELGQGQYTVRFTHVDNSQTYVGIDALHLFTREEPLFYCIKT